jgi:hypothetical protein
MIVDNYFRDAPDIKRIALKDLVTSLRELEGDSRAPYNVFKRRFLVIEQIVSTSEGLSDPMAQQFVDLLSTSGDFDKELKTLVDGLNSGNSSVMAWVTLGWWRGNNVKIKNPRPSTNQPPVNDLEFWKILCDTEKDSPSFEGAVKAIKSLIVDSLSLLIRSRSQSTLKSAEDILSQQLEHRIKRAREEQKKADTTEGWSFLRKRISAALSKHYNSTKWD